MSETGRMSSSEKEDGGKPKWSNSPKTEHITRSLLGNSMMVSGLFLLGSVFGFLSKVVHASVFGTGLAMDAYFAILATPAILMGMAPGVLMSVILPIFSEAKQNDIVRRRITSSLLGLILVLSLLILLFGVFVSESLVGYLVPSLPIDIFYITVWASRMLWAAASLSLLSGFLVTFHVDERRFFLVSVASLPLPILVLICTITLSKNISIGSIALGVFLGTVFKIVLLFPRILRYVKISNLISVPPNSVKNGILQVPWAILIRLPFTVFSAIAVFWIARQELSGLSYLGYSQSITGFLSVALGYGISFVTFPDMADQIVAGQNDLVLDKLERYLRYVFLLGALSVCLIIPLRSPLLQVAFQRGNFDIMSIEGTAKILPWYLVGAVSVACLNILRNLYFVCRKFAVLAWLGVADTLIFFVLAGLFGHWFSYQGIGVAYAVSLGLFLVWALALAPGRKFGIWSRNLFTFFSSPLCRLALPRPQRRSHPRCSASFFLRRP